MDSLDVTSPANASPPDFDFNLPCRFFKSSFARSLSLNNNNGGNNNNNQCKSLDYDIRSNNNNNNNCLLKNNNNIKGSGGLKPEVPPIPQRRLIPPDGTALAAQQNQNEANNNSRPVVGNDQSVAAVGNKPPALPARRPPPALSLHTAAAAGASPAATHQQQQQQQQQKMPTSSLTQLRQQAFNQALSNSNAAVLPVNVAAANASRSQQLQQQQQFNQKLINHYAVSSSGGGTGHNDSICSSSSSGSSNGSTNNNSSTTNFRRNIYVWPNKQNVEQDCNFYDADNDDDINFEYHDTTAANRQHQQTIPQLMIPTIMTTNAAPSNQHQQLLQQQQQQQQQHPYDVVHDNATNVEALILQNQVDTLHWQLKQVETSCDMYRAVMEEVARFLERYQKQRQLQQQLQQQYQQQLAAQKHSNMEQISRSKSLYQVNAPAGGQDKLSALGNNLTDDSSGTYLRVRSSTNLIDLKQSEGKNHKMTNATAGRHSKDDHNYETGLAPSQSYSAFKDFTWRRSPKKNNDSRSHNGKDDADEKLNQEAFRLLRTIQNLLNTSQHQPDIAHPTHNLTQQQLYQRHSLAPCMGRISKAISTTSVSSVPGAPMHNSTSLTLATNCAASTTSDSSAASPTIASASSNTLAPDMLFLRSANMRDSRLSLRSSTDSSVHSTSSVTSSASSKVETDEEPNTPFHSPPTNILAQHKPHHLAGSSTEDESGFSSISSFPDIGVPLNSTMLPSTAVCTKSRSTAKGHEMKCPKTTSNDKEQQQQLQLQQDSRNSTLKANVVGLPLNSSQDMSHRWDSPSKTYHNASTKFQRFSALTNNEDANTVLWV